MGGDGSGRHKSSETLLREQKEQFIKTTGGTSQIEIPNLSGVQKEALKTSSPLVTGVSSVFTRTGDVVAVANDYTWAQINKTTSDIADITTKSHTSLTDIGTNTHATIDTHLANNNIHVPSMTAGSVAFHNGTILSQDNANLFWDDTNNRLGIGTTGPANPLHVSGADSNTNLVLGGIAVRLENTDTTNNAHADLYFGTKDTNGAAVTTGRIVGVFADHTPSGTSGDIAFITRSSGTLNEKMRLLANGNVGIGTASPASKLEVAGTITGSGVANLFTSTDGGTANRYFRLTNTGADLIWGIENSAGNDLLGGSTAYAGIIGMVGADSLQFGVDNSVDMTILTGGNVGIGTTAPVNPLHVHKAAGTASTIRITNSDTGATASDGTELGIASDEGFIIENYENTPITFYTNDTVRMRILNTGQVGLSNTGNPTLDLSVMSGGFFISGGAFFYKGDQGTVTQLAGR